jgi:prophage regulatory protein
MQILRRRAVEARTGLKRSTIYFQMNAGTFPRPIRLGAKAVGWRETDIDAWLATRPLALAA